MPMTTVRPLPGPLRKTYAQAQQRYQEALQDDDTALAYLERERALSAASAARYGLGVVTDDQFGNWAGRISIPSRNARGAIVSFKFRSIDDQGPKYGAPKGHNTPLYNLEAISRVSNTVVITEGEFDAISVEEVGYPAVGVPGAENWKPFYRRIFEAIPNIVVCYDDDKAGNQLLGRLQGDMNIIPCAMPDGIKDPSDALKEDPTGTLLNDIISGVLGKNHP
jgi:DNA primase